MLYLETDRMTFHYRTHGDPEGIPMILIHGSYASSRWWVPFLEMLPTDIYAVALDLRGCGQSTHSDSGYTIEEQAKDLWSFVQTMGLTNFDLIAHSSGGAIAVEFALNHQDVLATLVLVDSVPLEGIFTPVDGFMLLEQMRNDEELLGRALANLMPSFSSNFMENGSIRDVSIEDEPLQNNRVEEDHAEDERFFQDIVEDAKTMAPSAFTAIAASLNQWNRFAEAKYLTLPSLIIWGDQDSIIEREVATRTLIAVPGANNLEMLQGVGHSPMIEAPLILAERIVDFITDDFAKFNSITEGI